MEEQLPAILNNNVSLSNLAARSAQGFTLREKRLVAAGLSKLDSRKPLKYFSDPDKRTFRISAAEYAEIAGTSEESAYKDLKAASNQLFDRYLRFKILAPRGEREIKLRWVEAAEYRSGEGWVELTFASKIMRQVCELKMKFTQYKLQQASALRSIYSWRLLELLSSHTNDETKERSIELSLDDLRNALEIPATYRFGNMKQRILVPAFKELAEKDRWVIDWAAIKRGRSVVAIRVSYKRDEQLDLFSLDE